MTATAGNTLCNDCTSTMSAECVSWPFWSTAMSCLGICRGASLADVVKAEGEQLCNLVTQLNALSTQTVPVIDFTKLDWGCVYPNVVTTYQCNCIGFPIFLADPTALNGIGYCSSPSSTINPSCAPTAVTTTNTAPTTILGTLQIMINFMKTLCCNPCQQNPGP